MKKECAMYSIQYLLNRYPQLDSCKDSVVQALELLVGTYKKGGKLLVCGNGGSSADAEHIVGELMKGFISKRPLSKDTQETFCNYSVYGEALANALQESLPAIALTGHTALSTAFANDVNPTMTFAQQVYGYGKPNDILLGLSTSGNSENIILAVETAKIKGLKTIAFTGAGGGKLREMCDVCIAVPEKETYKVQELHLPIYHWICYMLEKEFFA